MHTLAGVRRVKPVDRVPRPRSGRPAQASGPSCTTAEACPRRDHAPRQHQKPVAGGLTALLCDDAPPPAAGRPLAAARAFACGNGYLGGQMVDRAV